MFGCCCSQQDDKMAEVVTVTGNDSREVPAPAPAQKPPVPQKVIDDRPKEDPPKQDPPAPAPKVEEPPPAPPPKEEPKATAAPAQAPIANYDDNMPPGQYKIEFPRNNTSNGKIGLNVSHVQESSKRVALLIKEVKVGLVQDWNRENPSRPVNVGDQIITVNGIVGDSEMMLKIIASDAAPLSIVFQRQT